MVDKIHKTILAVVIVIAILAVAYTLVNDNYSPAGAVVAGDALMVVSTNVPASTPGVSHSILDIEGLDAYVAGAAGGSYWSRSSGILSYVPDVQNTNGNPEVLIGGLTGNADVRILGDLEIGTSNNPTRELQVHGDLNVGGEISGSLGNNIYLREESILVYSTSYVGVNCGSDLLINGWCDCSTAEVTEVSIDLSPTNLPWKVTCRCSDNSVQSSAYALCLKQ
jgi:hypothetical protein